jgi:Winged helix DNA-binding domain
VTTPLPAARLAGQQLSRHDFTGPREVVAWLGAVQAQDWAASKWAVGVRLPSGTTDEAVERAVDQGEIVRIHALRWTWQLIAPQDVRWILALVAPRLMTKVARRHRELELDAPTIRRSNAAIAAALGDGAHMTRTQLASVLARARVSSAGQRLPHLLALAELDALIGSGARSGKQPTWALLDGRVPVSKSLDRADALAKLARRYFRSRGPATVDDFAWWSGLSPADARAAVASIDHTLVAEVIEGRAHWCDPSGAAARTTGTHLLPAFDEYLVSYRNRDAVLAPQHAKRLNAGGGMLGPCVVHGGQVVGNWRRTLARAGASKAVHAPETSKTGKAGKTSSSGKTAKETLAVEVDLFTRATDMQKAAIARATMRYAAFLGRTMIV